MLQYQPLFPPSFPTSPALTALSFSRYLHVLPTSHRFAGSRPRGDGGRVRGGVSIATAPRCCGDAPSPASDVITLPPGEAARVRKRSGAPQRGPGAPSAASASTSRCSGAAGAPGLGPSRVGPVGPLRRSGPLLGGGRCPVPPASLPPTHGILLPSPRRGSPTTPRVPPSEPWAHALPPVPRLHFPRSHGWMPRRTCRPRV